MFVLCCHLDFLLNMDLKAVCHVMLCYVWHTCNYCTTAASWVHRVNKEIHTIQKHFFHIFLTIVQTKNKNMKSCRTYPQVVSIDVCAQEVLFICSLKANPTVHVWNMDVRG